MVNQRKWIIFYINSIKLKSRLKSKFIRLHRSIPQSQNFPYWIPPRESGSPKSADRPKLTKKAGFLKVLTYLRSQLTAPQSWVKRACLPGVLTNLRPLAHRLIGGTSYSHRQQNQLTLETTRWREASRKA